MWNIQILKCLFLKLLVLRIEIYWLNATMQNIEHLNRTKLGAQYNIPIPPAFKPMLKTVRI